MHDLYYGGLCSWAAKNGGTTYPINLPSEDTEETGQMNPSILISNNRILFNIRQVNYALYHSEGKRFPHLWGPLQYIHPENDISLTTKNYVCELSEQLEVTSFSKLDTSRFDTYKPKWNFIGLEDGRLVEWHNKIYLCGVRRDCYDSDGKGRMEMAEIERDVNGIWHEVSRNPIKGCKDDSSYCEKNWMPVADMPYHFVKWTNPTELVINDINTRITKTVVLDESRKYNLPRDIRGGSQVIRLDENHRMAITHEVDLAKDAHQRKDGLYAHRVIIWDNDWNIVKASDEFSFMGFNTFPDTMKKCGIEFTTGAAIHNGSIFLPFGIADAVTFLLKMPLYKFMEFVDSTRVI